MTRNPKYSLVEIFEQVQDGESSATGSHCGYCNGYGSISDGMWSYRLTVADYQHLLQRGWRRSGKYTYKPLMPRTCCPQYAIRCEALKFRLSKSQKKVLKRMHKFLAYGVGDHKITNSAATGETTKSTMESESDSDQDSDIEVDVAEEGAGNSFVEVEEPKNQPDLTVVPDRAHYEKSCNLLPHVTTRPAKTHTTRREPRPAVEINHSKTQRKAKDIRRERKREKLRSQGLDPDAVEMKKHDVGSSLESYFEKPLPQSPKHVLETRLVIPAENDSVFTETFADAFKLYAKYELKIHKKAADRPTERQFTRFLVESPLQQQFAAEQSGEEAPVFGSFHMQYILDGKLIGIDVLDVLPDCVTSVYFFYDPDYHYLSLGTYSVLREIVMVRELNKRFPSIKFASLGFYVNSCPKMQYKAKFQPSFLLCPETFDWYPLAICLEKLRVKPYQRFGSTESEDQDGKVADVLNKALILWKRNLMTLEVYKLSLAKSLRPTQTVLDVEMKRISRYASLVGRKCLQEMVLYCDNAAISRDT